jgi:hypothetical protein
VIIDDDDLPCPGCGGNHDGPHPKLCLACAYEAGTRRSFERDVDDGLIRVENARIVRVKPITARKSA